MQKTPERALQEAPSEHSKLGMHFGLTDRINTNIKLLKEMCAPQLLTIDYFTIGKYTNTSVALIYIKDMACGASVARLTDVLQSMSDYTQLTHLHAIEAKIRPSGTIIYSTSVMAERFDELTTDLMQGKIAVLADFTPFALITPITLLEQFQSPDDYYSDYGKYSVRLIRMVCFFFAMTLPAIYVALSASHPPWLPEKLFNNHELLHTFPEQLIILTFWRLAVDSGSRVHQQLAIMLTVIVTLVVSNNLIATKIVHPDGIVVVALSTFFAFVSISEPLKSLLTFGRYTTIIAAWLWGLPGIWWTCAALFAYGCTLRPFGHPFMSPLIPFNPRGFADTFIRAPLSYLWRGKRRL